MVGSSGRPIYLASLLLLLLLLLSVCVSVGGAGGGGGGGGGVGGGGRENRNRVVGDGGGDTSRCLCTRQRTERISAKNFSYGVSLVRNGWEAIFAGVAGIERDS